MSRLTRRMWGSISTRGKDGKDKTSGDSSGQASEQKSKLGKSRTKKKDDQMSISTTDDEVISSSEEEEQRSSRRERGKTLKERKPKRGKSAGPPEREDAVDSGGDSVAARRANSRIKRLSRTFDGLMLGGKHKIKKRKKLEIQDEDDEAASSPKGQASNGELVKEVSKRALDPPPSPQKSPRDSLKKIHSSPSNLKPERESVKPLVPPLARANTANQGIGPQTSRAKSRYLLEQSVQNNQSYGSRVLTLARAKNVLKNKPVEDSESDSSSDVARGRMAVTSRGQMSDKQIEQLRRKKMTSGNKKGLNDADEDDRGSNRDSSRRRTGLSPVRGTLRQLRKKKKMQMEEMEEDYTGLSPDDIKTLKAMKEKVKEMKSQMEALEKEDDFLGGGGGGANIMANQDGLSSPHGAVHPFPIVQYSLYADLPSPRNSPFFPSLARKNSFGPHTRPSTPPASSPRELPPLSLDLPKGSDSKTARTDEKHSKKGKGKKKKQLATARSGVGTWTRRKKEREVHEKDREKEKPKEKEREQQQQSSKKKGDRGDEEPKAKPRRGTLVRLLNKQKEAASDDDGEADGGNEAEDRQSMRRSRSEDDLAKAKKKEDKKTPKQAATIRAGKTDYRMELVMDKKTHVWKKKRVKVARGE